MATAFAQYGSNNKIINKKIINQIIVNQIINKKEE